jgi:hypothetical protein
MPVRSLRIKQCTITAPHSRSTQLESRIGTRRASKARPCFCATAARPSAREMFVRPRGIDHAPLERVLAELRDGASDTRKFSKIVWPRP